GSPPLEEQDVCRRAGSAYGKRGMLGCTVSSRPQGGVGTIRLLHGMGGPGCRQMCQHLPGRRTRTQGHYIEVLLCLHIMALQQVYPTLLKAFMLPYQFTLLPPDFDALPD